MKRRNNILTVAGFDPSGGAGVLADIKTFEANKCNGLAVVTANTIQVEDQFLNTSWVDKTFVFEQLTLLLKKYKIPLVKIGLIQSTAFLFELIERLKSEQSNLKIIWDPVLSASAGFDFNQNLDDLESVLKGIDILTPNWNEVTQLTKNSDALEGAVELSQLTKVYLKGGHNLKAKGKDYFIVEKQINVFNPKPGNYSDKHGSGCVFSSALAANLARGYPEKKAILRSKRYIEQFLKSNTGLLGYHMI